MPKPTPIDALAQSMAQELQGDTAKLAASLKSEMQSVGTEQMTKAEFLDLVHRNWADPSFRQGLKKQLGNKPFLQAAQDMVEAHGHPPIPPPLDVSGMLQAPTVNSGMAPQIAPPSPAIPYQPGYGQAAQDIIDRAAQPQVYAGPTGAQG